MQFTNVRDKHIGLFILLIHNRKAGRPSKPTDTWKKHMIQQSAPKNAIFRPRKKFVNIKLLPNLQHTLCLFQSEFKDDI